MKRLLWLYPRAWRRRYGEEMEALLEETRPTAAAVMDLLRGALDAQLHRGRPRCLQGPSAVGAVAALALGASVGAVAWLTLMLDRWPLAALTLASIVAAWLLPTIYRRVRRRRRRRRGQDPGEGAPVPAKPLPDAPPALAASRGSGRRSDPE